MPIYDRHDRKDIDQLVEEYTTTTNINRRQFLQRAMAAGLSLSAASALLAACGGGGTTGSGSPAAATSIDVLTEWSGNELANFQLQNTAFKQKYGITVNVESTRDLPTVLNTRVRAKNPPDVTGSPGHSQFVTLATQGLIVQLDKYFDMNQIHQEYAQTWLDYVSVNGHLYGVMPKANSKGTVWYNPKQFTAGGYTPPTDWNGLIALSDKIAASGKYPWSLGVSSGASSGWPACDWIDQIYLSMNGADLTNQWINHKIPWTHSSVKQAWQYFGQIIQGKNYINGGATAILATTFQDASFAPYSSPPKAYMDYLGDFLVGFITAQFPSLQPGTDYQFFPFPTINPQYAGAITGGADVVFAMVDNDATRKYMQYLSSAEAQTIWMKQGGASSVNKQVDLSVYPNDVQRNTAKQLSQAAIFVPSPDDQMPTAMENAFFKAAVSFIQNPGQLDSILSGLESTAQSTYTS